MTAPILSTLSSLTFAGGFDLDLFELKKGLVADSSRLSVTGLCRLDLSGSRNSAAFVDIAQALTCLSRLGCLRFDYLANHPAGQPEWGPIFANARTEIARRPLAAVPHTMFSYFGLSPAALGDIFSLMALSQLRALSLRDVGFGDAMASALMSVAARSFSTDVSQPRRPRDERSWPP